MGQGWPGGSGGGGGTGNLNGTLTEGRVPVASGVHDLEDSLIEQEPLRIVIEGAIATQSSVDEPIRFSQANDSQGPQVYLSGARGDLEALEAVTDEFVITAFRVFAYGGATYSNSANIRFVATGAPVDGNIPTRIEFETSDDEGDLHIGLIQNPDGSVTTENGAELKGRTFVNGATNNRIEGLNPVSNEIVVDSALSNWFTVVVSAITGAVEFQVPLNPDTGRTMQIRILMDGDFAVTFDEAGYRFEGDPPDLGTDGWYYLQFVYNEMDAIWDCLGGPRGPFGAG